jgi:hypothetical protein
MSNRVSKISDALPPSVGGFNKRLGVFGGESAGFANSILDKVTYSNRAVADKYTVAKGMTDPMPKSIFNKYALFNFRGMYGGLTGSDPFNNYLDRPNNPLMGGHDAHNVSIAKLIEFFEEFYPKIGYKAQDFLYLKHYRKIPVNHLVTLRRFPVPVEDNIFDLSVKQGPTEDETVELDSVDITQVAGVTAVTYLGETAGNKLDDILKFSYGLNWNTEKSEMETIEAAGGYTQQPFYNKIGKVGRGVVDTIKGVSPQEKFRKQQLQGDDRLGTTYANFTFGPLNVIDETTIRKRGLKFENDIKLTFDYELRSLNYVNPKIAMIDIISNMLTMTINNAQFFGGGHRYYGSAGFVSSSFGNMNKLRNGDFSGYMGTVVNDVSKGLTNVFGSPSGGFDRESIINGASKLASTIAGNSLGGILGSLMGSIGGTQATKAFLSAEPTGNWHITVGNPLNPIVMMGNMYCDNTVMTLGNGLGYDDFPIEVKFEIDLKHGKPRDKGDIENMFNAGRGRIYASEPGNKFSFDDDTQIYGSVPNTGKTNLQKTQSAPAASDFKSEEISNINGKTTNGAQTASIFTSNDGEYVSNLVSMIIDS